MATFLTTVFLIICVLLIVVVLLQKGRGGGVGGLFGGGGSSAFGTRTGDVFTWVTIVLVAFFLLLAVGVSLWFRPPRYRVSQPVLYPASHAIDRAITVNIGCNTRGADIHFTVDGSGPTRASLKYDAPVRVEPGTIIRAQAYLTGWDDSFVTTGTYVRPSDLPRPAPDTRPTASAPVATPTSSASRPASAPAP